MIYTKATLKQLLDYADKLIDFSKTEKQLHKEIKCSMLEYEMYGDDKFFDEIFLGFLSLCCLKHS